MLVSRTTLFLEPFPQNVPLTGLRPAGGHGQNTACELGEPRDNRLRTAPLVERVGINRQLVLAHLPQVQFVKYTSEGRQKQN